MSSLRKLEPELRATVTAALRREQVPGYVAGIWHDGQMLEIALGVANSTSRAVMVSSCAFPLGSVTKVLTATLLLRFVERGKVSLDDFVIQHLPDFRLATPDHAARLLVRHLLNHTNGIDADTLFPEPPSGENPLQVYMARLVGCRALFEPDECISYSNPGFVVAGRLLEAVSGSDFATLMQREVCGPAAMIRSTISGRRAALGPVTIGHHRGPDGSMRPALRWTLPASGAPAGTTAFGTVGDLIRFGRVHLEGGRSLQGHQILSEESVLAMRQVSAAMQTPNCPPVGLGWWLPPFGDTVSLFHLGGSPGGRSILMVFPCHALVFAAYGNAVGAMRIHDALSLLLAETLLGLRLKVPGRNTSFRAALPELWPCIGAFAEFQFHTDVHLGKGNELITCQRFKPTDSAHASLLKQFTGGVLAPTTHRLISLSPTLFAPAEEPLEAFRGIRRRELVSFHNRGRDGQFCFCLQTGRIATRCGNIEAKP